MTNKLDRIIAKLPPTQRRALKDAFQLREEIGGPDFYPNAPNMGVRRRLHEKGLIGKRLGHPLTKLGREIQRRLLGLD